MLAVCPPAFQIFARRLFVLVTSGGCCQVDIDIKLRTCAGSCRSTSPFSVDHRGYQTARDELSQAVTQRRRPAAPPQHVPRIRVLPAAVGPATPADYRTIPEVQRELLTQFEDFGRNRIVLEESEDTDTSR